MPDNFYAQPSEAMRACEEEIQQKYENTEVWAGVYGIAGDHGEVYFYLIATPDQDWEALAPGADCTLVWERPNNAYWQLAPGVE